MLHFQSNEQTSQKNSIHFEQQCHLFPWQFGYRVQGGQGEGLSSSLKPALPLHPACFASSFPGALILEMSAMPCYALLFIILGV